MKSAMKSRQDLRQERQQLRAIIDVFNWVRRCLDGKAPPTQFHKCLVAAILVAIALYLTLIFSQWLYPTLATLFFAAVAIATWYGGVRSGSLATVLSVLALNYFFVPPVHQFSITYFGDFLRLIIFALVATIINLLNYQVQRSKKQIEQLSKLYALDKERQLHMALASARMGMWDWNLKTGEIKLTEEHEKLFDIDIGTFDGRYETFNVCLHPEDRFAVKTAIDRAIENNSLYQQEYRVVCKDNTIRWIEARGQVFYDKTGRATRIIGTAMDIQERKQAETDLREQEERWQLAIKGSNDGIWDQNLLSNQHYLSPRCREIIGYADDEITTFEEWLSLIPSKDKKRLEISFTEHLNRETSRYACEYQIRCKNGTYKWLLSRGQASWNLDGVAVRAVGFITDITERKQAEAALLNSERRYASLARAIPVGIFRTDADGNCLYVNSRWCQITGLTLKEAQGTGWVWRLHPQDRDRVVRAWYEAIEKKIIFRSEYRFQRPDGEVTWVFGQAIAEKADDGTIIGYLGSITDVNEQKRAELALRQMNETLENRVRERTLELSDTNQQLIEEIRVRQETEKILRQREREYKTLAENSPDAIVRVDRQLRHIYVNSIIEKDTGIAPADFLGKTVAETGLPAELAREIEAKLRAVFASGKEQIFEFQIPTLRDGIKFYLSRMVPEYDVNGEIESVLGISYDITKQKQHEASLKEANRRWNSLLENIQLAVVGLDEQGYVNYVNPFLLKITGYKNSEVIGKNWFSVFLPDAQQEQVNADFRKFLANNVHLYYENAIVTKSGQERLIAWNNTILQDTQEKAIGSLSIGEDITERYKLEEVKNEFISIVSHEVRTPLTSIHGALGLLAAGVYDDRPEKVKRMIEIALTDCERLGRLVDDILDLERLESERVTLLKEDCEIAILMQQAIESVGAIAERDKIILERTPIVGRVCADFDAIVQALTNLLANAIKFSYSGTKISLSAEFCPDVVLFQVKDRGKGIPRDKLESIFGKFKQVDVSDARKKGGTGLGLAICKKIVEQHGGKIWAEQNGDLGSIFKFTLPVG
jgi:PAS domain S-box-containing protein